MWQALERTDKFTEWWHWLKEFHSAGIGEGDEGRVVVQSPLAYRIRFVLRVVESTPPGVLRVRVSGDIDGEATLELSKPGSSLQEPGTPQECHIRLLFDVEVRRRLLRALSLPAHAVLAWGHNHVMTAGMRRFRTLALGLSPVGPSGQT
ncbi:MAG TPA: hypothetical protein VNE62_02905 [Actinomycetota bacterium]|nr:hypothetical protein [Actinomycetota bacterium]